MLPNRSTSPSNFVLPDRTRHAICAIVSTRIDRRGPPPVLSLLDRGLHTHRGQRSTGRVRSTLFLTIGSSYANRCGPEPLAFLATRSCAPPCSRSAGRDRSASSRVGGSHRSARATAIRALFKHQTRPSKAVQQSCSCSKSTCWNSGCRTAGCPQFIPIQCKHIRFKHIQSSHFRSAPFNSTSFNSAPNHCTTQLLQWPNNTKQEAIHCCNFVSSTGKHAPLL